MRYGVITSPVPVVSVPVVPVSAGVVAVPGPVVVVPRSPHPIANRQSPANRQSIFIFLFFLFLEPKGNHATVGKAVAWFVATVPSPDTQLLRERADW